MPSAPDALISLGTVFTLFFVTLGPLKILGPFAQLTRGLHPPAMRGIALRAFVLAVIAAIARGFIGIALLGKWHIPTPDLVIAGGIIFFIVGLSVVLEQYHEGEQHAEPLPTKPLAAAMRITFPIVITPYGIAALIVLLANSDGARTMEIILILLLVMVLNLLGMLFARQLMSGLVAMVFRILGAVLGVLQVALAVAMVLRGLRDAGVISTLN